MRDGMVIALQDEDVHVAAEPTPEKIAREAPE